MPILKFGEYIRLTGNEATQFQSYTGHSHLPKTVAEYNDALDEAAVVSANLETPEGNFLAELIRSNKLVDESSDGEAKLMPHLVITSEKPPPVPFLKDGISGFIKFSQSGLDQYAKNFKAAGIDIADIRTEDEFETAKLNSIRTSLVELMCRTYEYPELNDALTPFIDLLKFKLEDTKT
jgi:hypothetical protein